ncbi:MAG: hypothetical protein KKB70_00360 [Proteobacteria bacterium]|nr:hypothetical protein [Pseudomonadota bacterium]MBU1611918.1 hypothetical protein [Pseudomonadota bacterium]
MRTTAIVLTLCLALLLPGCASKSKARDYATTGTLLGAAVGALTAKNKVSGAAIGAGAGLLLGYILGNELDKDDQEMLSSTLEHEPSGNTSTWNNPDTGYRYEATPSRAYVENDRIYRDIEIRSSIDGRMETVHAKAYRDNDGTWQLVQ